MRSNILQMYSKRSSREKMAELKEKPSIIRKKVFISMVFSLKALDGTGLRRDSRNQNLRSFTINSQFFM